ncbi:MAG: hypothetical protein HUJ70_05550, partial [Pseudobutyrivibrio sp.]|nr:hypothetical protein [Pseudobutyrivibrio sp.]
NIYELPAISYDMWEALLPYKDDMLNMTQRAAHNHVLNYFEMDDQYMKHIRYWNWILDSDEIDMAYFCVAPHSCWEYAIYALCKIKGIPTLIVDELWALNLGTVSTNIEHIGINVKKCFEKHENIELDNNLQAWYDKTRTIRTSYNPARIKANIKENRDFEKKNFMGNFYEDAKAVAIQMARYIIRGGTTGDDLEWTYRFRKQRIEARRKYRTDKPKEYFDKKYATHPVEGEEYILYLMQQMPEATLLPKSGVASNQLVAIELLADAAAKRGVKLYVKEHYVQLPRDHTFYTELLKIPNIRLIKLSEPTGGLQDKALAIASQNGTCLAEGLVKGIPIMCTAPGVLAEAPNAFFIRDEKSVLDAIDAIRAGFPMDTEENRKFFAAFGKTCVRTFLDWSDNLAYEKNVIAGDIIDLILKFQAAGMPEDFYYEREDV